MANITLDQLLYAFELADKRLDGLELGKQDISPAVDLVIPTTGWGTDTSVPSHPQYYDIAVTGLQEQDIVAVEVAPGSCDVARAASFANTQSYAGKVRLRAKSVPTEAITAQYRIIKIASNAAQGEEA